MDELYIDRVLKGEVNAFRFIVQQYQDMAFNIAMSVLKNEFDSKDAVQEAFIIAFRKLSSFRRTSTFSTWFYRILVNESLKILNKQKSNHNDLASENIISEAEVIDDFESLPEIEQRKFYVDEALKLINAKESLALTLFYLEESSINEISEITGWSISNIKVILSRGRKSLYCELEKLLKFESKQLY